EVDRDPVDVELLRRALADVGDAEERHHEHEEQQAIHAERSSRARVRTMCGRPDGQFMPTAPKQNNRLGQRSRVTPNVVRRSLDGNGKPISCDKARLRSARGRRATDRTSVELRLTATRASSSARSTAAPRPAAASSSRSAEFRQQPVREGRPGYPRPPFSYSAFATR